MAINREYPKNINILEKPFNSEMFFLFLFCLVWANNTLISDFKLVMYRLPFFNYITEIVVYLFFITAILLSVSYFFERLRLSDIFLYFAVAAGYQLGIQYAAYTEVATVLSEERRDFILFILTLFLVGAAYRSEKVIDYLHVLSVYAIFADLASLIIFGTDTLQISDDNMGMAYKLLPHVALTAGYFFEKYKKIDLIAMIIGFVLLISYGTRGPVVAIIVFAFAYFVFVKQTKNKIVAYLAIILFLLVVFLFMDEIIDFLREIVSSMGMSTRILDSFKEGEIADPNGRDNINKTLLSVIKENPWGLGVAADREFTTAYAHNIILELWVSFGVLGGSLIFGILIALYISALSKCESSKEKTFIIALLCTNSFFKLFLSSSYLLEPNFFLLIGLCVGIIRRAKEKNTGEKL